MSPFGSITLQGQVNDDVNAFALHVEQGDEFNITCHSKGGPNNTHEWRRNGLLIEDNSTFVMPTVSTDRNSMRTLHVLNFDAATHKGIYTCLVQNEAGNDSASYDIIGIEYL